MARLYHHPLHAPSRFIRLILAEKGIPFELVEEPFWLRRPEFLALSPSGEPPVLVEDGGAVLNGAAAIAEYLEEVHPSLPLLAAEPRQRLEARRLFHHYLFRFSTYVGDILLTERVWKRLASAGEPDAARLRFAFSLLPGELAALNQLAERRKWLAGDSLSLADLAAAAYLSALDYIGVIPWGDYGEVKEWYARLKSRPCFRGLLQDYMPSMPPPAHYADLDF